MYSTLTDYYTPAPQAAPVVERVLTGEEGEVWAYIDELKRRLAIDITNGAYDAELFDLLNAAIEAVEDYTRLAIRPGTVTARYSSYDGSPLPYGPVWATPAPVVTKLTSGATITMSDSTASAVGTGDFPAAGVGFVAGTVQYSSGYSRLTTTIGAKPVPSTLINAVIEHAASRFRSSGVAGAKPDTYWKTLAGPKRRFD